MEQLWSCKGKRSVKRCKAIEERKAEASVDTYVVVGDDLAAFQAALLGGLLLETGGGHVDDWFF